MWRRLPAPACIQVEAEDQKQILGSLHKHDIPLTFGAFGGSRLDMWSCDPVPRANGESMDDQFRERVRRAQTSSTAFVSMLLGLSGAGKTRAFRRHAAQSWCLLLECGTPGSVKRGQPDVVAWFQEARLGRMHESQRKFEDVMKMRWLLIIASRVLALVYLIGTKTVQSPADWLAFQLRNPEWLASASKAFTATHKRSPIEGLENLPAKVANLFGLARLTVLVDEAQSTLVGQVARRKASTTPYNIRSRSRIDDGGGADSGGSSPAADTVSAAAAVRPPLTLMLSSMIDDAHCAVFLAGTMLRLATSKEVVDSFVLKGDDTLPPLHDLSVFEANDVRAFLDLHLDLADVDQQVISRICSTLQGRPRFSTAFLQEVYSFCKSSLGAARTGTWKSATLTSCLASLKATALGPGKSSLVSALRGFTSGVGYNAWNVRDWDGNTARLADLLERIATASSVFQDANLEFPFKSEADLLNSGICRLVAVGADGAGHCWSIAEPLALQAMQIAYADCKMLAAVRTMGVAAHTLGGSPTGFAFERVVGLRYLALENLLDLQSVRRAREDGKCPAWLKDMEMLTSNAGDVKQQEGPGDFANLLEGHLNHALFPSTMAGADIVDRIDRGDAVVFVAMGLKLHSRRVSSQTHTHNIRTTNLETCYHTRNGAINQNCTQYQERCVKALRRACGTLRFVFTLPDVVSSADDCLKAPYWFEGTDVIINFSLTNIDEFFGGHDDACNKMRQLLDYLFPNRQSVDGNSGEEDDEDEIEDGA